MNIDEIIRRCNAGDTEKAQSLINKLDNHERKLLWAKVNARCIGRDINKIAGMISNARFQAVQTL